MNMATYSIGKRCRKRLGMVGFAFFLLKEFLWLAAPLVMYLLRNAG